MKLTKKIATLVIVMDMSRAGDHFDRKTILAALEKKLGMGKAAASTYYANARKSIYNCEVRNDVPEKGREKYHASSSVYVVDGIWFNSIGRVMMEDVYVRNANVAQFSELQHLAYDYYIDQSLAEYREAQTNREPSAEEMFEMRAAFGPGETVVNILTGKKIEL